MSITWIKASSNYRCRSVVEAALVDLRGYEGRRPRGRNSFNFMQFLAKFAKIVWEILDVPLASEKYLASMWSCGSELSP